MVRATLKCDRPGCAETVSVTGDNDIDAQEKAEALATELGWHVARDRLHVEQRDGQDLCVVHRGTS